MSSSFLEIVEMPNGDIVLQRSDDDDAEPLVVIQFSEESRIYLMDGTLEVVGWTNTQGEFPRNFAIDPTGKVMLIANQFTSNIVSFWVDGETGALTPTGAQMANPHPTCLKFVEA